MAGQGQLLVRMANEGLLNRTLCAPVQTGLTGPRPVPVRSFCIQSGETGYRLLMGSRWDRARRISSLLIGPHDIPVTPLWPNPRSGESFHIVRVTSDWKITHAVDLLVKDRDSYVVAFRRLLLLGGRWSPGIWYKYSDVEASELPREIRDNCVCLGFNSAHGDRSQTTPGGMMVLQDMFEVLSTFEDCERGRGGKLLDEKNNRRVKESLYNAIVIFAEAFRFRSIYLAVLQRIRHEEGSSELDASHWCVLHNWGHFSYYLLALCKLGPLPALGSASPPYFRDIGVRRPGSDEQIVLDTLEKVIGASGELMLVRAIHRAMLSDEERAVLEKRVMKRNARQVMEPGFRDVALPDGPNPLW